MVARIKRLWRLRRTSVLAAGVLLLAAAGLGAIRLARAAPAIPTIEVRRGEFVDRIVLRGEIKALRSTVLSAPSGSGDIQIVKLVKNGTVVKKGDIVVQFDATELQRTLETKQTELKQAEAEIEGARAQAKLQEEQDLTELTKARYDVERARLDAGKQEILSRIDGEKARLTLADAEQKLREAEEKLKSNRAANAAAIESKRQKREKALFDVRQTEQKIASMTLKAPTDGMVTLMPNWRAGGFFRDSAPEFKEGDRAWPGAGVAEIPDLRNVQVAMRVDETDRGRLKTGQDASVRVDAVPDTEFQGTVADISPLTKADFSGWPPVRNFDVRVQLPRADPRLRPGMSANARVAVEKISGAVLIPAEAAFQKSGRTVVYVLRGSRFEERAIEVARRGSGEMAVARGVESGERIATKDPTLEEKTGKVRR